LKQSVRVKPMRNLKLCSRKPDLIRYPNNDKIAVNNKTSGA